MSGPGGRSGGARPVLPGATLGVLGSGQLGRMFALEARALGYRVATLSPEAGSPTGAVADREVAAPWDDLDAVRAFARRCDAVTVEFENVPAAALEAAAEEAPVRPGAAVLHHAQHRAREKRFLAGAGLPTAPFREVASEVELRSAWEELGPRAVLKTAGFGYDGKGQARLGPGDDPAAAWRAIGGGPAVLEGFVDFALELSVVVARGVDGAVATFEPFENLHEGGILDLTVWPARVGAVLAREARDLAVAAAEALDAVGVLCVEMFVGPGESLRVNEVAPRPHNSGHLTIEAAETSQFGQLLRVLCGLPLGSCGRRAPAAMANLLGDLWREGEPDWAAALAVPGAHLHLYGKSEARPGRKMGHVSALGRDLDDARERALTARAALRGRRADR